MSSKSWMPRQKFYEGEFVAYNGHQWRCTDSHISGPEFDKSNFSKFKNGRIPKKREKVSDMKYIAYTSMDQNYYNKCGKHMLSSYKKNWSHIMPIHVYNEGNFNVKVKTTTSVGWDLGPHYSNFMIRHSNDKVKTFAKKGFTVIHAMQNIEADRIIWLDADTVITNEIPLLLLDLISPNDTLSTHFSVWHEKDNIEYHSCETGFFILNQNHPGYKEFCETYKDIYINDKTDGMRRFYDGEIYGKTVDIMAAKGHKMLNLNPGRHKTPISRSVIAPYISHFKADLKNQIDYSQFNLEDEI